MSDQDALDYVVIRFADDLPEGAVPAEFNGMWVDVAQLAKDYGLDPQKATVMGHPTVLTDRQETRDDGTVGQVCEVRP
jgi:hypothetical protein